MIQELPIDLIDPNPFQTRRIPEDDLVHTVETLGLLRIALIVRPVGDRYQLVFGHRILHTLRKLRIETVNCDVRELDDQKMVKMFYQENEDRKSLSDLERGEFFKKFLNLSHSSLRKAAKQLNTDPGTVSRCMAIADAARAVLESPNRQVRPEAFANAITETKFKEATKIKDPETKVRALALIAENELSTSETKTLVAKVAAGSEPATAANEVLLAREGRKPERYSLKKKGITRVACVSCKKVVFVIHDADGRHMFY